MFGGVGEIVKGPEPIIIPLVLNMAEFEHQALLEEWFSSCTVRDRWQVQVLQTFDSFCYL